MGRPERVLDPENDPLHRFAAELRGLREKAGKPSYRQLSRRAHFSVTALSEAAGGVVVPSLAVTLAYAEACGGDRDEWESRWHALMSVLAPAGSAPEESAAPYLGLAPFGPENAPLFFGRERLVRQLRERLAGSSFLALFGPSGAGKSSVLRAGLLPALTGSGAEGNGGEWLVVPFTPGEQPLRHLSIRLANAQGIVAGPVHEALTASPDAIRTLCAQTLSGGADETHLVIVVDQFEETFTLCRDEHERRGFVAALLAAAREPRVRVVLGVRADFYGHCAHYPALVSALQDNQVLIGTMDDDDLRAVVTGPARHAGVKVDPELVDLVVDGASGQVGALSLVSHALLETWRRRRGESLTVAAFRATGDLRGAISQTAERVYGELDPDEQDVAKGVFLRLTMPGDGTEDTRRRAPRAELEASHHGRRTAKVLDTLIAARLVVAEENTVTIAHEALIRGWPRLRTWPEEDRERLHAHRRLAEAAAEWDRHDRDEAFLYRGTRLSNGHEHPARARLWCYAVTRAWCGPLPSAPTGDGWREPATTGPPASGAPTWPHPPSRWGVSPPPPRASSSPATESCWPPRTETAPCACGAAQPVSRSTTCSPASTGDSPANDVAARRRATKQDRPMRRSSSETRKPQIKDLRSWCAARDSNPGPAD